MADPTTIKPEDATVIRGTEEEEGTPPRPGRKPPYLVLIEGPHSGSYYSLAEGKNSIGRAVGSAIRVEDQSVSRHHAEIDKSDAGWIVRDLGSKNGTRVNGNPVTDAVVIGHKDTVRTGIYLFRLVTQEISVEDEMALPPEAAVSERTVMAEMPAAPEAMTESMEEERKAAEAAEEGARPPVKSKLRKYLFAAVLFFCVVGAVGYLAKRFFLHPAKPPVAEMPAVPEAPVPPPTGAVPSVPPAPPPPPVPQTVPVFLDFASSPLPAIVSFEGKELGKTPLRVNVELEPDKAYTAEGAFVMPELNETYKLPVNFGVEKGQSVVPILFRGPIGMIKVMNLPRDAQFYLEGNYEYDRFKERPAKLTGVVLQKPIYIPYGQYKVELRRQRQLGESQTYVPDIVFRRDFAIAQDSPSYVLDVKDEDLKVFPVDIKSDPPNADVFIDGKSMGKTPFNGLFPLGQHTMTLRKEGYFENTQTFNIDINTPFVSAIKLETSVAGAHINNAKTAMHRELWQEAVNELAQSLASNPAPTEIAQANYLLGRCYLNMGDIARAITYFEQGRLAGEWKYQSMLGMVAAYGAMQKNDLALPLLVEVLLNVQDDSVKRDAHQIFQQISPFKSVIYVHTDPEGARIMVNDKQVAQPTPAILHDLPLGSYNIRLEKPGYQALELKLTLSVNEFNPVIVKLKPIVQ